MIVLTERTKYTPKVPPTYIYDYIYIYTNIYKCDSCFVDEWHSTGMCPQSLKVRLCVVEDRGHTERGGHRMGQELGTLRYVPNIVRGSIYIYIYIHIYIYVNVYMFNVLQ